VFGVHQVNEVRGRFDGTICDTLTCGPWSPVVCSCYPVCVSVCACMRCVCVCVRVCVCVCHTTAARVVCVCGGGGAPPPVSYVGGPRVSFVWVRAGGACGGGQAHDN